jgi:formylglycine-generating enzyme required for sulfatase activity
LYFRGVKSTIEAPRKEESAKETKTETKTAEPAPKQEVTPPAQPESESLALILDGIPMDFAAVQPGRFVMGLNVGRDDQKPEHMVEITKKFQIGRTEVTEKHWNAVMSGKATGSDKPKVNVSYLDAQAFLARLNGRNDGWRYRLPTEAEWEYCARAGDPREMPRDLDAQAWTGANSGYQLRDVASEKMPNLWGIYGMLGNASEWTQDWLDAEYYSKSPARDPQGPATGEARIFRGGNANMDQTTCNYYWRFATLPTDKTEWIGFRVVRERKP